MVSLTILSSKPVSGFPLAFECSEDTTIANVKSGIASKFPKFYSTRQKLTLKAEHRSLSDNAKIIELFGKEAEEGELVWKDLGAQVSRRTVSFVENAGPLLIHPLIYHFPKLWYGQEVQHSGMQTLVYGMVLLHFVKRELETMFVHRSSHGTIPVTNLVQNLVHYHILSGLFLAYDIYRPKFSASSPFITETVRSNDGFLGVYTALWLFAELSNLNTHLTLRALRPEGARTRGVPFGYGFDMVSCPNYTFEAIVWFAISCMTGSIAAYVFTAVAFGTMAVSSVKKHKNYKKIFGTYPSGRKAMVPFVL